MGAWILDLGIWIFDLGSCVFFWRLDFETWIFGVLGLGFWSFDFGGLDLGGFGLLISFVHFWKVLWV